MSSWQYLKAVPKDLKKSLINGAAQWTASGETFKTISPIDGSKICSVASGGREDLDLAGKAAKAAIPSWLDMPAMERRISDYLLTKWSSPETDWRFRRRH